MFKHTTDEVVMVRPTAFMYNPVTAVTNLYQQSDDKDPKIVQAEALKEFEGLVKALREKGVTVNVLEDTPEPSTPDSIFPNNWFSTHEGGTMVVYPMFTENRQSEIAKFRSEVEEIAARKQQSEKLFTIIDYSKNREREQILEGTGSMVIDRKNKVAYCVLSPRADKELFLKFCEDTGHKPVYFRAFQDGAPIYHTNVLMGIGGENVIICLDAICDEDRERVASSLREGGNNIIDITPEQVKNFLGNTLELKGGDGKNFIAMSDVAYNCLTPEQKEQIEKSTEIVHVDIANIEFYGGGSVRCMIAEVF
ncbi:MAG: amidinotransferase [Tissierellia bacterium]|nr:arginine deiminase-related protein [Bacillota bacterium]NLL23606.1 amidinotransferase [Tissierellia bacterium]